MLDEQGATDVPTIVGGTGAYAGAHGTLTTGATRGGTSLRFELAP